LAEGEGMTEKPPDYVMWEEIEIRDIDAKQFHAAIWKHVKRPVFRSYIQTWPSDHHWLARWKKP